MLRDRLLLRWRCRVWLVIVWGVLVSAAPRPGDAAPLPPSLAAERGGDLEPLRRLLEEGPVRERLAALGVAPDDATRVLERLSPEERAELAARADELGAGGDSAGVAFLALVLIVVALVILILELLGRRVISRPVTP